MVNAKTFLEKRYFFFYLKSIEFVELIWKKFNRYNEDIELEDAIHTAISTLKEGFEGEMNEHNIEIGIIGEDKKFRILTPSQIKDYIQEVL